MAAVRKRDGGVRKEDSADLHPLQDLVLEALVEDRMSLLALNSRRES
jgi:hypothetical protein